MRTNFLRILKTHKPKPFNYRPLYYDEGKEALQKRVEAIREEVRREKEQTGTYESGQFKERMHQAWLRRQHQERNTINMRVLLIAVILAGLVYGFLYW